MPAKIFQYSFLFISILGHLQVISQVKVDCEVNESNPFEIISATPCEGNYLYPVQKIIDSKESLLTQIPKSMYYQSLAGAYCNLGDYYKSLSTWDSQSEKSSIEVCDTDLANYKAINAQNEIATLIAEYKLVMINEAHHISLHRFFVKQMLQDFYDKGFKYIALETLNHNGLDELVSRGYPLQSSGTYTIEPQFGQLIRSALSIGFKLIPYDISERNMNLRDSLAAENIIKYFKNDKDAKILVYAGFGHIKEKTSNGWITLAQAIKLQTGIDPLTIDQVELTEKSSIEYQSACYNEITKAYSFDEPIILKNIDSSYWNLPKGEGIYDIQLIHPVSHLKFGRPGWLNNDKSLHKRKIFVVANTDELLVQAYSKQESESFEIKDLVPFDQTTIDNAQNDCFLFLPKGEFIIRVSNKNTVLDNRELIID